MRNEAIMNEKKQPKEQQAVLPANSYQTGSTAPPKSHAGLVAVLLSATILICGISTIFSLMRINLLQKVMVQTEKQKCTMAFSAAETPAMVYEQQNCLRIEGQPLNVFWQSYRQLPQGLYVSRAYGQPLRSGDIILSLDQIPITDWDVLFPLLEQYATGDTVTALIQRDGTQMQLELTIYE